MITEDWRDIPGFENCYQASSLGRIRSLDRMGGGKKRGPYRLKGKFLSVRKATPEDRPTVTLTIGGVQHIRTAPTWIWAAFNGALPPDGMSVIHINDDRNDHRPENLQLVTESESCRKYAPLGGWANRTTDA